MKQRYFPYLLICLVILNFLSVQAQKKVVEENAYYKVRIMAPDRKHYLSAEPDAVNASKNDPRARETFILIDMNGESLRSGDRIHLIASSDLCVTAEDGGAGGVLSVTRPWCRAWETFQIFQSDAAGNLLKGAILGDGATVSFRTSDKAHFISAVNGGGGNVDMNRRSQTRTSDRFFLKIDAKLPPKVQAAINKRMAVNYKRWMHAKAVGEQRRLRVGKTANAEIPLTPQPRTKAGVRFFGDWPATGKCDFTLRPSADWQAIPDPRCNDTLSAIDVPFGMSVQLCEHDAPKLGDCRYFLPGMRFIGSDMNDQVSSIKVNNHMTVYLSSKDYPRAWKAYLGVSSSNGGETWDGVASMGNDDGNIEYSTLLPLPRSCRNPKGVETTKNGDSFWRVQRSRDNKNQLDIYLRAKYRGVLDFGGNNWVGVQIVCE